MGFNAAQIKAIQQTAKTAMLAATEVKTLSQVLQVAKETAASGWAETWQIIFGDLYRSQERLLQIFLIQSTALSIPMPMLETRC